MISNQKRKRVLIFNFDTMLVRTLNWPCKKCQNYLHINWKEVQSVSMSSKMHLFRSLEKWLFELFDSHISCPPNWLWQGAANIPWKQYESLHTVVAAATMMQLLLHFQDIPTPLRANGVHSGPNLTKNSKVSPLITFKIWHIFDISIHSQTFLESFSGEFEHLHLPSQVFSPLKGYNSKQRYSS